MYKSTKSLLAVMAMALCASAAQASTPNLISNGDFESTTLGSINGFKVANAGANAITGWTIGGVSVDVINGAYGAISGNSIDLLGTPGPGSLSQSFNTIVGHNYLVSFGLSANGGSGDSKSMTVSVGNNALFNYLGEVNKITNQSFLYTANYSGLTALTFTSAASGYSGAVIDNVSVMAAVPEPSTYAMMLGGLGLVGFMTRRRKSTVV